MWPRFVEWQSLRFGVEIEFVGGNPKEVQLLPNWNMALDELQIDDTGEKSGSELQSPPLSWDERYQIQTMLDRLKGNGAVANWNCGLHVHIGLEPWGEDIVLPLAKGALMYQDVFQKILQTPEPRKIFCPPLTEDMYRRFCASGSSDDLRHTGRPQSHRCGINLRPWYDIGTVEIRYANGTLDFAQIENTLELCLRFVSAIGRAQELPSEPFEWLSALEAPSKGYPPPIPAPQWYRERIWLENMLLPILQPFVEKQFPKGEILEVIPGPRGIEVTGEKETGEVFTLAFHLDENGWALLE